MSADRLPDRPGIDYEHFVPDTIDVRGPLTREAARRLAGRGVTGIKIDASIPADALTHLREIPALERIDLSEHTDLTDNDLAFLEAMPQLTAVAFALGFVDVAPWFLKLESARGHAQGSGAPIADDRWTRVTMEIDESERRILIDCQVRHTWTGNFAGLRSRLTIGPLRRELIVRELTIAT